MAVASHAIVFPTTGWESDLSCLLHLNEDRLVEFYRSKSTTERSYDRSYNFSVESYLVASTVKTKSSMQSDGLVFIKAQCYRSKKKNAWPYIVHAAIGRDAKVAVGNCECPAGQIACNHLISMLHTVVLLQCKGFSEAP